MLPNQQVYHVVRPMSIELNEQCYNSVSFLLFPPPCSQALTSSRLAIAWKPNVTELGWLHTTVVLDEKTLCGHAQIHRMRGNAVYEFHLLERAGVTDEHIISKTITTESSGFGLFDAKFAVINTTAGFPTWEVLSASGSYQQEATTERSFRGIFSLDAEGYVVCRL